MSDIILEITGNNCGGWKNQGGTADRQCSCGTWKDHWENFSYQSFDLSPCSNSTCLNPAEVGAHVFNSHSNDKSEYIVPFCQACNHRAGTFQLRVGTTLVSANKSKTCDNDDDYIFI